jgi:hypothetical protein
MRVTLGPFARSGIEQQLGAGLKETVETAVRHYANKLTLGRPPLSYPQFLGTDGSQNFGTTKSTADELAELELKLDSETEAILRREAMRQNTDVGAIASHSVMVYLAELDFLSTSSHLP